MPEHGLVSVPEGLSDYESAALQPAADCVAGVESGRIEPGDVVAVLGQGTMGLHSLQLARHALAERVIAIDVRPEPLALAAELGADDCVDASSDDPVEAVAELTEGRGADVVIECSGGPQEQGLAGSGSIERAFRMARDSGRVVVNSLIPGVVPLKINDWRIRSVSLVFPALGTRQAPSPGRQHGRARSAENRRADLPRRLGTRTSAEGIRDHRRQATLRRDGSLPDRRRHRTRSASLQTRSR